MKYAFNIILLFFYIGIVSSSSTKNKEETGKRNDNNEYSEREDYETDNNNNRNVDIDQRDDHTSFQSDSDQMADDKLTAADHSTSEDEPYVDDEHQKLEPDDLKVMPKCWMVLNTSVLFNKLDRLDDNYENAREAAQKALDDSHFDDDLKKIVVDSGGAAMRELTKARQERNKIPAGLNLGGFCMLRMRDSVLFFHRVKLRNSTVFTINYLRTSLKDMTITLTISLNDLHLKGAYERCITDKDPSILFYAPSYGEVQFLLKDVKFKAQGRLRLISNRLTIDLISSEMIVPKGLMTFEIEDDDNVQTEILEKENLGELVNRVKTDLDKWLKDYFNDQFMYTDLEGLDGLDELHQYDLEKSTVLDEFMDEAINQIQQQVRNKYATDIKLPRFTILGSQYFRIKMFNGQFRGLETIYKRSMTSIKAFNDNKDYRKVDALVGFSDLKVVYQYEAMIPTTLPAVSGTFVLSANDLSAHLSLTLDNESEFVDIDVDFMEQTRPEFLTVEGAANTAIANFKHVLEHEILALMSNTLINSVKLLKELPKCEPNFYTAHKKPHEILRQKGHKSNNGIRRSKTNHTTTSTEKN